MTIPMLQQGAPPPQVPQWYFEEPLDESVVGLPTIGWHVVLLEDATGPTFASCAVFPLLAFLACALPAGAARVAHATPAALNGAAACAT